MNDAGHPSSTAQQRLMSRRWWLRACCFLLTAIVMAPSLAAQVSSGGEAQDKPLRFDLTPLIGYRTSTSFPTGPAGPEPSLNAILDAKPSYGVAFGMRVDEEDVVEFRWARQDTHLHLEGTAPSSNERVVLDQFHGDFTHEYILEDWHPWARPFVMGSIGATRMSGGAGNSFTRFSFGLGGGVKVYFNRHVGFRVQAEWLPLVVNPAVGSFVCGGGCTVQLRATLVSQGEVVIGPVFRF